MKKCEYCGKEISYFEQYCDDECHLHANKFYELQEKFGKLFSVINGICVFGIPVGLFAFSFSRNVGTIISVASCFILGLMLLILPFPTDGMLSKYKIKNAMKKVRIVGIGLIFLGIIIALFSVFFVMYNPQ